ncbi:hypothetical protein DRE_06684 [Drechslerella stenobrocha 248]|uniref:Histone deacetylase interacting domain-containing protein n=1 Tax=Drechslerella stenobrocha 248 TaxID=1043628 RepID=W7HXG2_9PEZI|nr:hypothetical protein DRE_06684 [Drechslerella stenobrocha 248]
MGQQQQPAPGHMFPASSSSGPIQQPPPQERLGGMAPNSSQPLSGLPSHALQTLSQLPPQGGPPPPQPHQEAVASIVNAPASGMVGIQMGIPSAMPASYRPLNVKDALSYLDQVKVQFADHPDVYNRFLDIMKDFKSQAIDTPGVIERVSTLFAGHPNLIQGFNTFLPPGYRIECSSDPSDPHSIRVTTPQGTTTATSGPPPHHLMQVGMPPAGQANGNWRAQDAWGEPSRYRFEGPEAPGPQDQPSREQLRAAQVQGRPGHQMPNQAVHLQQPQPLQPALGQPSASDTVSQLQNAAAATNGTGPVPQGQMRQVPPTGPLGHAVQSGPLTPGADIKRGPVEFNHAISYVNKIKTRFSSQPEIYKNFLEILQTYQRESKPIQEVYSQVTQLFNAAPDLLEDFKQFLPESAAQARQKPDEHTRDVNGMGGPGSASRGPPPQGHFAPPLTASKDTGKRKRTNQPVLSSSRDSGIAPLQNNPLNDLNPAAGARGPAANKRPKIMHKAIPDAPGSPTLIPANPSPLVPTDPVGATSEEIAFFDRARKYIGNKQTYNEFLKLLNLFSQDLMDKSLLVSTLESFLGTNPELFNWIKRFLGIAEKTEDAIQNALKKSQKVRLNVCRALGPSYRLLPKLEANKPCSGRDEMCREVLNDEWASHPTWASEDSGFVGHKKNQYEEMLHRVEEERHDYDFHIECNSRTIQLLEPIAQRIASMGPEEQANFRLSPGLGGQNRTIYQRAIKKVYRDDGLEVIKLLHERPASAVPIILKRLKMKDEEWRFAQREWNKVWREQTAKIFYKSLDHQGNTFKQNDKRTTTNRHFISEIDTLYKAADSGATDKPYHLKFSFPDLSVLLDVCRLLATQLDKDGAYSHSDRVKIATFIQDFIPKFFGIRKEDVESTVGNVSRKSPDDDMDTDNTESTPGRNRKKHEQNLRQDVLRRGKAGKSHKIDGVGSNGTTPEPPNDDDPADGDPMDVELVPPSAPTTWINPTGSRGPNGVELPGAGAGTDARDIIVSELKERTAYNLFSNSAIYCFIRLIQVVYQRLLDVKGCEEEAKATLVRRKNNTTARKLGLMPQMYDDFFTVSDKSVYYSQVLEHCERLILGNIESSVFEDGMRCVYIQKGWQLYTIDKHIATLNKMIQAFCSENRDNCSEIFNLFAKDRATDKTNFQLQMSYRREVEAFIGREEPTYRIEWNTDTKDMAIQLLFRVDPTHTAKLTRDEKWSYYVDAFIMSQPTEGVPPPQRPPFLVRNLPTQDVIDSFSSRDCELNGVYSYKKPIVQEGLELKICVNSYKLFFTPGSTDAMILSGEQRAKTVDAEKRATARRKKLFQSEIVANPQRWKDVAPENRILGYDGLPGMWKP